MQYKNIAKQLGDYYLPEPQAIMNEIISAAEKISENPDDREAERLIALCVKLASTVKKEAKKSTRRSRAKKAEAAPAAEAPATEAPATEAAAE